MAITKPPRVQDTNRMTRRLLASTIGRVQAEKRRPLFQSSPQKDPKQPSESRGYRVPLVSMGECTIRLAESGTLAWSVLPMVLMQPTLLSEAVLVLNAFIEIGMPNGFAAMGTSTGRSDARCVMFAANEKRPPMRLIEGLERFSANRVAGATRVPFWLQSTSSVARRADGHRMAS